MPDDTDLDLGEADYEEEVTFPPPERRIVTQAYDLSVNTLVEQWADHVLVIPPMQREYVWDNGRASRLVESLMLNIPIPPVFFAETEDAKYEVIDGHQRIASIVRYINNEFSLSGLRLQADYNRLRFHQLPQREQRFLRTRVLRAIIISIESHPAMKFEIFQRLNTGAIALNAQEIRNALYQGPLNDLLNELVVSDHFRKCIATKAPRRRMVDQELVLRFLALREGLETYRPPLLRFMNDYMRTNRDAGSEQLELSRATFGLAANFLASSFPHGTFRMTGARGEPLERNVNRALFDAQMLSASWVVDAHQGASLRRQIQASVARLYRNQDFLDAVQRATGDRRRTIVRIRMYVKALQGAGVTFDRLPSLEV